MPCFSFGQLFPKVPEFRGNIKKVVEKWYGKEYNPWRKDSGSYKPGVFSGLKYTYLFDENSQLTKRIITFKGQINNECLYLTKTEGNRKIVQEKMKDYLTDKKEYLLEYENFLDQDGKIRKVNFWEQVSPESPKELFLFEMNAEYNKNKLTEFTRYNISTTGDTTSGEKCILTYDTRGRLKQIDRKDVSSGFTNSIHYYYNGKGLIERSSIDLMAEMQEYGKKQSQDIYYKYDKHKNWTRMYRKLGKKIIPEAKRTIRYQ
jgi:hypothetical protein